MRLAKRRPLVAVAGIITANEEVCVAWSAGQGIGHIDRPTIRVGSLAIRATEYGSWGVGRDAIYVAAVRISRNTAESATPRLGGKPVELPRRMQTTFGSNESGWAHILVLQTQGAPFSFEDEMEWPRLNEMPPAVSLELDEAWIGAFRIIR
jgi:hypothetical protein